MHRFSRIVPTTRNSIRRACDSLLPASYASFVQQRPRFTTNSLFNNVQSFVGQQQQRMNYANNRGSNSSDDKFAEYWATIAPPDIAEKAKTKSSLLRSSPVARAFEFINSKAIEQLHLEAQRQRLQDETKQNQHGAAADSKATSTPRPPVIPPGTEAPINLLLQRYEFPGPNNPLVRLLTTKNNGYIINIEHQLGIASNKGRFSVHEGSIDLHELMKIPFGGYIKTSKGISVAVLRPTLFDIISKTTRNTQVIYPKDAAYIVHRLNIGAGSRVIEAGTGSANLTTCLAFHVGPTGKVYTYEQDERQYVLSQKNIEKVGLSGNVVFHHKGISEGFDQKGVDSLFLDVRDPWNYLDHVRNSLIPGGTFGSILPTTNQVSDLLQAMEATHSFVDIDVVEIMLRRYKPVPDRLRPQDTMYAHTGYLLFAKCMHPFPDADTVEDSFIHLPGRRRKFMLSRQRGAEEAAAQKEQQQHQQENEEEEEELEQQQQQQQEPKLT